MAAKRRAKRKAERKGKQKPKQAPIPIPSTAKKFANQQAGKIRSYAQEVNQETDVYMTGVRTLLKVPSGWAQDMQTGVFRPATKDELKVKKEQEERAAKLQEMLLGKPKPEPKLEPEPKPDESEGEAEKKKA